MQPPQPNPYLYPAYGLPPQQPQPQYYTPPQQANNGHGYYYGPNNNNYHGFNFDYTAAYPKPMPTPQYNIHPYPQQPVQSPQQQYAPKQPATAPQPKSTPPVLTPPTPTTPVPNTNTASSKIKPVGKKYMMNTEKIGHGTFASVYEGWRTSDNSRIAIKKIDVHKLKPEMVKYLDFEMEIMKQTNHENILKLYEVINTKTGSICLVLEFMDGGELGKYIKTKHYLTEEEAKSFLWDLAKGLYCLHRGGAVHRDLKPANLLLKKNEDGTLTLKIADLGLGRNVDQSEPMNYTQGLYCYFLPSFPYHPFCKQLEHLFTCHQKF